MLNRNKISDRRITHRTQSRVSYASRRRGQIEMFGLAFIVVLISLGFFIYLSLRSSDIKQNPQKEYTNDKMANDFVLAILNVNVEECPEYTVKELAVDCQRDHRIQCGSSDHNSCATLNTSVYSMLQGTFDARNMQYRFYSDNLKYQLFDEYGEPVIDGNDYVYRELFDLHTPNCTSDSIQGKAGWAAISLHPMPGEIYLYLNLCYQ